MSSESSPISSSSSDSSSSSPPIDSSFLSTQFTFDDLSLLAFRFLHPSLPSFISLSSSDVDFLLDSLKTSHSHLHFSPAVLDSLRSKLQPSYLSPPHTLTAPSPSQIASPCPSSSPFSTLLRITHLNERLQYQLNVLTWSTIRWRQYQERTIREQNANIEEADCLLEQYEWRKSHYSEMVNGITRELIRRADERDSFLQQLRQMQQQALSALGNSAADLREIETLASLLQKLQHQEDVNGVMKQFN